MTDELAISLCQAIRSGIKVSNRILIVSDRQQTYRPTSISDLACEVDISISFPLFEYQCTAKCPNKSLHFLYIFNYVYRHY